MKSICEPLRYCIEIGSTTTLTPDCSTTSSSSAGSASSDMPYEKPEQPPGETNTRNAPSGACCVSRTVRNRSTASSVKVSVVMCHRQYTHSQYQVGRFASG